MTSYEEFKSAFDARAGNYTGALLSVAMRRHEGHTKFLRGTLVFTREQSKQDRILDYGEMVLLERQLTCQDALDFVKSLIDQKVPTGYDFDSLPMRFTIPSWWQSESLGTPVGFHRLSAWPAAEFLLNTGSSTSDPNGPLVRHDLPLVITPSVRIDEWIGITTHHHRLETGLAVVMPDFRLRIAKIRFEETAMRVFLETDAKPPVDLIIKAALDDAEVDVVEGASPNEYRIEIERLPSSFHLFVFDRSTGMVIDWARVYLGWTDLPPEIEFSLPGKQFEILIAGGETQELEFKRELDNGFRLVQSVVAFANTDGGIILVGVDDNAKVVGTDVDSDAEKVEEWIERRCDPPVTVSFDKVALDDKRVLAIRVPKGVHSPCQHRENGVVYVRRGATDRPASRTELQSLFKT